MDIKERIIAESGAMFTKYGIRSVTMDNLSEEMRISKRTIYEHFKDKDTLLLEVIRYFKGQQSEQAHHIIDESESAIEAMFRIMKQSIQLMKQLNPAFFHDIRKYHSSTCKELSEHSDIRDFSVTQNILQTGIKQKVFRKEIKVDIVNQTLHTLFDLFSPDSTLIQADYNRKDLFENIIIPYFRGISTDLGVKQIETFKKILE